MSEGGITVRGIPEVQSNLRALPKLLVMECFSKGLHAAAQVMESAVRVRLPYDRTASSVEEYGLLLNDLVSIVTIDTNGNGGQVQITFRKKAMVALWVEYGHRLVRGGRLASKKNKSGKGTVIGQVPPHPFLRPAFEAAADAAIDAFVAAVQSYMTEGSIAA